MILYSHPTASAVARHTASALRRAGVLGEFWTYATDRQQPVLQSVSFGTIPGHDGRSDAVEPPEMTPREPVDVWSGCASGLVSRALDDQTLARLETRSFAGVYAYEAAAAGTFQAARKQGLLRVYDLPHANWTAAHPILKEEAEREPEWAETLWPCAHDAELAQRRQTELQESDLVFVGSTFGMQTLEAVESLPAAIAVLVPGAPATSAQTIRTPQADRPLRVLYAGTLSQRGGLAYAFRACDVVQREMDRHDVFLFPAIYDTGNRVLLEALTRGLPVLATANSAAPDLIADGVDGYIVPTRSPVAIVE